MTPTDIYDHILGSGATSYSWYYTVRDMTFPTEDNPGWHVCLLMDDPDDDDETIEVRLDVEVILEYAQNVVSDSAIGKYGDSLNYKVSQECRQQCALLLLESAEVDFDAGTADELIQCIAYGEVVFA